MSKNFGKKTISLLMISQLTLSTLPMYVSASDIRESHEDNQKSETIDSAIEIEAFNSMTSKMEDDQNDILLGPDFEESRRLVTNRFRSVNYSHGTLTTLTSNHRVGDSVYYQQKRNGRVISSGSSSLRVESGIINQTGIATFSFNDNNVWVGDVFEVSLHCILGLRIDSLTHRVSMGNVSTSLPRILGANQVEIYQGDDFDPLIGVSATDFRGENITNQIRISGQVDVNTVGNYNLTYSVTDIHNRSSTVTRLVRVLPKPEIMETTINPLTTSSILVNGNAEPNSTLSIKVGDTEIGSGNANNNGRYEITIPSQAVGTVVTAQANLNGVFSNIAQTTVERSSISETTISDLNTDSTSVTGTAEPNAEITIKVGDTIIANGRVGSDGKYSVTIDKQQAGTVVTAQARLGDIESNIAKTTVIREGIDETTISKLNTDSTSVTGTAEPNAEITIKAGDTVIANGRVGSDGIYSLTIEKQPAGTVVTAQATLNGISSNIAETMVERATIAKTTLNEVTTTATTVSGTAEPDAHVEITIGDSETKNVTVDSEGDFEVEIDPQAAGTTITAQASIDGLQSNIASTIVVTDPANTEGTVTPDVYNVSSGDQFLRGTYTGDVASARVYVNGSSVRGGNFADGSFEFFIGNRIQSVDDVVEIEALDQYGKVLDRATVELTRDLAGTITPDKYSYTDTMITGTFTGDINFANLVIDGQSVGNWGGTFNKETDRFEFFVHAQFRDQIRTAAKVELQTYHRETVDGQTIDHKLVLQPVEIVKATGSIQPAAFKVTDSEITGTFTGDVNFANLIVDGRSVSWGGTFNTTDQTFTYFVNQDTRNLIRDAETVELVAYHREVVNGRPVDTELDRSVVTIDKEFTGTITPNPYKLGDRIVTGTYTGDDINFGRLEIDGMILWVSCFSRGTFTAYLNQEQANSVTKDSKMTIHALHRFANLCTQEIAQATVSITE
ncbi:immunoglobulin-like domain-containing protein [Enterococcus casseliflavus]|uniref:immunoglobulin-like domain-containing protein n=1 Tax=Enterococcus casseliflavus TaxID=37734 RepID=UPI0011A214FE|nr:immunoglobulin-like domain-containing protein [Enterococcus casseliflavus]